MAHLWIHRQDGWAVLPLEHDEISLADAYSASTPGPSVAPGSVLRRGESHDAWHLVAAPAARVRVNGLPLATGIRTLADRDEVQIPGGPCSFFSLERLAVREPLPPLDRDISCPRCRQQVARDSIAVRCPGCGLWHHESPDLPCWTYAPTCAVCAQPTADDAGFRWTPEDG